MTNILSCKNRSEFRAWLLTNGTTEKECYIQITRGRPKDENTFWYLDAVEEALCFGWIDTTWKKVDGIMLTRFTPRQKKSVWTELNKERAKRLIRLGLMTAEGEKVLPDLQSPFVVDNDVKNALLEHGVWERFCSFPPLYQRVRAYNVAFYKNKDKNTYQKALTHLLQETEKGKLFGEWNDYGRLLEEKHE